MKRFLVACAVAGGCFAAVISTSAAQEWSLDSPLGVNQAFQDALVWTGQFDSLTDGELGAKSVTAISAFQRDQGWNVTGDLLPEQKLRLFRMADEARQKVGWRSVEDRHTGIKVSMPSGLVRWKSETPAASRYASDDGAIEIAVKRFPSTQSMRSAYDEISSSTAMTNLTMRVLRRNTLFISGENDTRSHYYTARVENGSIIGIGIITPRIGDDVYRRLTVAIANAFHTGSPDYAAVVARILPANAPRENSPPARVPAVAGYQQRAPTAAAVAQQVSTLLFDHAELVPVVQDILKSAGIERYKILPSDPENNSRVFWAYEDGGFSSLTAARPRSGLKLDDISNSALNGAAEACKGEFGSKKNSPRYERGSEVREVVTACRTVTTVIETQFNILELPSGVILRFSHTSALAAGAAPPPSEHEMRKKLESAAWTVIERLPSGK